jgi:hypothetical protein
MYPLYIHYISTIYPLYKYYAKISVQHSNTFEQSFSHICKNDCSVICIRGAAQSMCGTPQSAHEMWPQCVHRSLHGLYTILYTILYYIIVYYNIIYIIIYTILYTILYIRYIYNIQYVSTIYPLYIHYISII